MKNLRKEWFTNDTSVSQTVRALFDTMSAFSDGILMQRDRDSKQYRTNVVGGATDAVTGQGRSGNVVPLRRDAGRKTDEPSRRNVYRVGEFWYFTALHGVEIGPYPTRFGAEVEAELFDSRCRGRGDAHPWVVVREFVRESLDAPAVDESSLESAEDR